MGYRPRHRPLEMYLVITDVPKMSPKETSNDKIRLRKRPEMTLSKLPMAQPQRDFGHSLSVRLPL